MPEPGLRARAFRFLLRHFLSRQFPPDTPLPEQRARMERSVQQFLKTPEGISIQSVQAGGVPAEWVTDESSNPNRVILYFHGGGYTTGSALTHRDLTGRLARASQARVLALNYRLAPEHPYPAAVEDALAAYHWLLGQDILLPQIVLAGDSAGGGLALALCLSLRESSEPQPAAVVGLSPWVDLSMSGESVTARAKLDPVIDVAQLSAHGKRYAGQNDLRLPLISPLFADLHGLPPLLIHVGSHEVLFSDATQLAERARACGVDVTLYVGEGLWHVWHIYASFVPEAQQAIEMVGKYVRKDAEKHNDKLVKILCVIPQGEEHAGQSESLWAHSLGDQLYELQNIPVFAENLNLDDIVRCDEPRNKIPVIKELVRRSGNRTLRVTFEVETPDDTCVDIMWELRKRGIQSEKCAPKIFMFNVPPTTDYIWARDFIRAQEEAGLLSLYEQADD